jgi:hypothetical protein
MLQRLLCGHPPAGIIAQHAVEQIVAALGDKGKFPLQQIIRLLVVEANKLGVGKFLGAERKSQTEAK